MSAFGTEISANRRRNAELSTEQRVYIIASLEAGKSPTKIADIHNVARRTVYNTRDRWQRGNLIKSRPRSGRPPKFNDSTRRYIYRLARKHPRWSYSAIIADPDESISRSTIQRILRRYILRKWKSKKRIHLTADDARKRLIFCRKWANFDRWEDVIFSDECTVQRGSNSPVQFVFRF
jgi:transposase